MEHEICRRETTREPSKLFFYLMIACIAIAVILLMVVIIVASSWEAWEYIFDFSWAFPYAIILAVIFIILAVKLHNKKTTGTKISLVLTNKRIYTETTTSKFKTVESYNLDKIDSYSLNQTFIKDKTISTLKFTTSLTPVSFVVDEEFYNEFVKAINATIVLTND